MVIGWGSKNHFLQMLSQALSYAAEDISTFKTDY